MAFRASSDGGRTFGPVRYLRPNIPGGQFDPQLATDGAGDVLASWMDGKSRIMFSKSTDHGQTWTRRSGRVPRSRLGRSPVARRQSQRPARLHRLQPRGELGGAVARRRCDVVCRRSRSAPRTATTSRTARSVTDDGDVVISTASYALPYSTVGRGAPIQVEVERSTDGGATFDSTIVDTVEQPRGCVSDGCPFNHYGGHAVIALSGDTLVLAYDGAVRRGWRPVPLDPALRRLRRHLVLARSGSPRRRRAWWR